MKRRHLIKGIAASGLASVGIGSAAHTPAASAGDLSQYDHIRVVSGGETVDRIDATWEAVRVAEADLEEGQFLVTPDGSCTALCESRCPCYPCAYGCYDCCDPTNNVCSCCSEFDDPENHTCCSDC